MNAVMHRDYRSTANVQVYIFRDRVEVVNPGGLPAGMTEADLGTRSVPRNPLLFGVCSRMDMVEQIGSGVRRIRELCRDYGVPEPQIMPQEDWMTVVFPRDPVKAGLGEEKEKKTESTDPVTDQEEPESRPESRPESDLGEKILKILENDPLSKSNLAKQLGHTSISGALNRQIRNLLENNFIEHTIPDKPNSRLQRYRLTEKGREATTRMES